MRRQCADCGLQCDSDEFSGNQWRKGPGMSRCHFCVEGKNYACVECQRRFENQNNLNMHMQVHRPREIACPVCGERRFRSGANAVQHLESGYCSGCRGRDNARQQIYNYAKNKREMQPFMSDFPLLENGSSSSGVPDCPYHCPECNRSFRHLSQLLQHQDQKHNNLRLLRN